jgi:hypothetical protein
MEMEVTKCTYTGQEMSHILSRISKFQKTFSLNDKTKSQLKGAVKNGRISKTMENVFVAILFRNHLKLLRHSVGGMIGWTNRTGEGRDSDSHPRTMGHTDHTRKQFTELTCLNWHADRFKSKQKSVNEVGFLLGCCTV